MQQVPCGSYVHSAERLQGPLAKRVNALRRIRSLESNILRIDDVGVTIPTSNISGVTRWALSQPEHLEQTRRSYAVDTIDVAGITMAPIKLGIIGYGFSTKCFHLPFILPNPDLEVYAFLQRKPAPQGPEELNALKWGHCTVDFPSAKHYTGPDEFFGDANIELVLVLTSDGTHQDSVVRALESGKHGKIDSPVKYDRSLPRGQPVVTPWQSRDCQTDIS